MSFASILSGPAEETPRKPASPVQSFKPIEPAPVAPPSKVEPVAPDTTKRNHYDPTQDHRNVDQGHTNGTMAMESPMPPPSNPTKVLPEHERESVVRALERLDAAENSDGELQGLEEEWKRYRIKGKKRVRDVEGAETRKRKVRDFPSK